jgi:hypothetical protein
MFDPATEGAVDVLTMETLQEIGGFWLPSGEEVTWFPWQWNVLASHLARSNVLPSPAPAPALHACSLRCGCGHGVCHIRSLCLCSPPQRDLRLRGRRDLP